MSEFRSGFVSIIGKPNAGKSTLLNGILGEKLAIVSPKVQTTRQRIKGILTEENYQIIFSDTPGLLESQYKLQDFMKEEIKAVRKDTDVLLFLMDVNWDVDENIELYKEYNNKKPVIFILNKCDAINDAKLQEKIAYIKEQIEVDDVLLISALKNINIKGLIDRIVELLPEHPPYFSEDEISDLPIRFFVSEIVREKVFELTEKEVPYHTAVLIREYKVQPKITRILADIVVSRETQKGIIIGKGGEKLKRIGTRARLDIEKFIDSKVYLELHVKVRKDWRNNSLYLKEYGY